MVFNKNKVYFYFLFIVIIVFGLFTTETYSLILTVILVYLYVGSVTESRSNVHMMFFLGYNSFIFLPALLNWYYLNVDFNLYFLTSFVSVFFLNLTRFTVVKNFRNYGSQSRIIFVVFSIVMIFFSVLDFSEIVGPLFALVIFLLCLCFKQNNFKNNFIYLLIFLLVFFSYVLFTWGGYGRTVVVGWLLLSLLQFSYSIDFKVNKYLFGLIPGLAAALFSDRDILNLKFSGFESSLADSAYQPYRLASSFIDEFNANGFDVSGFLDQVLFTVFVFIPRDIWSTKPLGFGFEYTVTHYDQQLIDAGHSIAPTLIGDHIYYLGYLGVISSMVVLLLIAFVTRFLYNIKGFDGNGVVVFSASMMVLVWGGMTSFSARVALPSIIFIVLIALFRRVFTGELKLKVRTK